MSNSTTYNQWWDSGSEVAVRYGLTGGLLTAIFLYFTIGYWHAGHRIRKGLPPLAYHSWMIRRPGSLASNPYYGPQRSGYQGYGEQYPMNHFNQPPPPEWAPPPPAYNAGEVPPAYIPPPDGSFFGPGAGPAGATKSNQGHRPQVSEVDGAGPSSSQIIQAPEPARTNNERST